MNKKNALVSIVLIALMSLSLIPIAAFGFHTPSSTDDSKYEQFGPRPSQVLIKIYTNYAAELAGFEAKEFDLFDFPFDPLDFAHFETIDPTHSQYASAFFSEFGLWELDVNNQVFPTNQVAFRQALSHIVDKDDFINQAGLVGSAVKADSTVASIPGWYDTSLTNLYNLQPRTYAGNVASDSADWNAAYNLLQSVFGAPVPDPINGGLMYGWVQDAPLNAPDANGVYGPEPNNQILLYSRSDSYGWRAFEGVYVKNLLEVVMPATFAALGHPAIHINVDNRAVPRGGPGGCSQQVMFLFRYHLYTGGWSFGRDPDSGTTLYLFSQYYPGGLDYPGYNNPTYDAEVNAMLTSAVIGVPTNPSDGKYHAYLAQDIFMGEAGIIPLFSLGSYKGYLANWRNVVNQAGFGVNSWWTKLNAYDSNNPAGFGDVLRYGWQGDVVNLSVIAAQWYWDWEVLGMIYDTLIAVNPYNVAQDLPYIAKSWNIGTTGSGNTVLNFTIRNDVFWQDVPFHDRSAIAIGGGHQIDGPFQNVQFTPVDVAFSLEYTRDNLNAWNQLIASPVDYVVLNPAWTSMWPASKPGWYTADTEFNITWQSNYVQFSPSVAVNDIMVVLNQPMAWIGLHWIGGVPLLPMHLWSQITITQSTSADLIGNDMLYGTGDFIFLSRTAGVGITMIPYVAGTSYRGITTQNDFFWHSPVRAADAVSVDGTSVVFKDQLVNDAPVPLTVTVYWDFNVQVGPSKNTPGPAWTDVASGTTAPMVVTVPANGVLDVATDAKVLTSLLAPLTKYGFVVRVHWSLHIAGTGTVYGNFVSFATEGMNPALDGVYFPHVKSYVPGDINHSGKVDSSDAALLGAGFGKTVTGPLDPLAPRDINNSGKIDSSDAAVLGGNWAKTYTKFNVN